MRQVTAPALWGLQKAIYAELKASDVLREVMGDPVQIFDDPPPDSTFPYLTIGEARTRPYDGIDDAMEHDISIYVFSKYAGRREIKILLDAIYVTLHEADIEVEEFCLASLRFIFADIFRRNDGSVFQGVIRFRAITQPQTTLADTSVSAIA